MKTYKKLSANQIYFKLMKSEERTEFGHDASRGDKMDELEDAAVALDINFEFDIAAEMVIKGADLSDSLSEAQVEFCCG